MRGARRLFTMLYGAGAQRAVESITKFVSCGGDLEPDLQG
jgi:hypothetical protein